MTPLTKKQQNIFNFICEFIDENQHSPSYRDIATAFQFSSDGTVRTYLEHLEKKNYIERQGKARSIKIKKKPTHIPILGSIKAGTPTEAIESSKKSLYELPALKQKKEKFALTIKGDSMINAGIQDGDIAIIDKSQAAKTGNIVAAIIDNEATLKRLHTKHTHIELHPENPNYPIITLTAQQSTDSIIGKCVGIIRNY